MPMLIPKTIESEDDRAFLEQLFDAHCVRLRRKAAALTQSRQVAEDLVQDVFLYVAAHVRKFRQMDSCTLRHILDISVKRRCCDWFRAEEVRKKHQSGSLDDEGFVSGISAAANTEEAAIENLSVEELTEAIRKLPDHYRYVIEAKYLLNLKDSEIAKELGIGKASVRQYLTRARRKICELCEGDTHETER